MLTVLMAAMTGFVTPAIIAFQSVPGLCPYDDFNAIFNYIGFLVFGIDIFLSFNLAYYDEVLSVFPSTYSLLWHLITSGLFAPPNRALLCWLSR
jgi:hypothetical protein